jgi:hypothetical protein
LDRKKVEHDSKKGMMKMWIPMWVIIIAILIFTPLGSMVISILLKPVMLIGDFFGLFKEKTTLPNQLSYSQSEKNEDDNDFPFGSISHRSSKTKRK